MKITRVLLVALVASVAGFVLAENAFADCQELGIVEKVKDKIKESILGIIPITVSVTVRATNPEQIQQPGTVTVKLKFEGGLAAYVVQSFDAEGNKVFEKKKRKAGLFSDNDEVKLGVSPFTTVAIGTALSYRFRRAVYCF